MAYMIDKDTVASKNPPKSTQVEWIDTSQTPNVLKHFYSGKWRPVSGGNGTKKYTELTDKP